VNRSFRHPFRGSRLFAPESERKARTKQKNPRQPKMRQNKRISVEGMLDAPDTSASRPGLRIRVIALVVIGLFALLGLRLWALTVFQSPAAAQAVNADRIRVVEVAPTRGLILDRYGNPLVNNVVTEQITLARVAAIQEPAVVGRLAALIGETNAEVEASIKNPQYSQYKPVPVLSNAPLSDVLYISEHQSEFPGVSAVATTQRKYPQTEIPGPAASGYPAAQTLGFVNQISSSELASRASRGYQAGDAFGQSGLEYQYEPSLHGTPGQQQLEVNPAGQVVGTLKTTPAKAGDNLVTNIDTGLQQVADNALASQILSLRRTFDPMCNNKAGCYPAAINGAVVVMDPQTGAVYAMSSFPSYNPAVWVGGISNANYADLQASGAQNNYAIEGQYTPGSTFKLNTATAALDTGLWSPGEYYDDTGSFKVPGCQYNSTTCNLHNAPGDGALGEINLSTAISVSDDDFFYNLGAMFWDDRGQYGDTPIQNQAAQYSLGELTGIDLPGETPGRLDSQTERLKLHAESPTGFPNTTWYTGDNVEMAFGQGATVITPIEQAVAYSTFANGGTRYAPEVAAAVVSPSGKVIKRFAPKVTGHVNLPPSTYAALMTGFEGVVQGNGTAASTFAGFNFPGGIAGKTGTADTEIGKEPTAWFVGFGPTVNPQYVVVCVIDQAGYGATAAAPVVRSIFSYLAANPVTAPGVPPLPSIVESTTALQPPTTTTTTTTTVPASPGTSGSGGGGGPTTTAPTTTAPTTSPPTRTAPTITAPTQSAG
jgi:penicillin-binding protein 2